MLFSMFFFLSSQKEMMEYPNTNYLLSGKPSRSLEFDYTGSTIFDPKSIIDNHYFIMDTYVNWIQVKNQEEFDRVINENQFYSAFIIDFNKNDVIISFGRELIEMQCFTEHSYPENVEVFGRNIIRKSLWL